MNISEFILSRLYTMRSEKAQKKNLDLKLKLLAKQGRLLVNPNKPKISNDNRAWLKHSDLPWYDYFYSVNGKASSEYIPLRPYYYLIEPTLNHRLMVSTLKDKNFYELFYQDTSYPRVICRRIHDIFYDSSYRQIDDRALISLVGKEEQFIVKASLDSGGGQSIYLFKNQKNGFVCDNEVFNKKFLEKYKHDFVLQEAVTQHSYYRKFNPSSNNTVRVLTYRSIKDDSINVLHTLLRIGQKGSYLDHDNFGGVSIAIDPSGILADCAFDGNSISHKAFNGITFGACEPVPYIEEIVNAAKAVAGKTYYGRLLALDFTVSEEGNVLMLDLNCWRNGISHYQLNSGTLFGGFTREILEYCTQHPKFNILRVSI